MATNAGLGLTPQEQMEQSIKYSQSYNPPGANAMSNAEAAGLGAWNQQQNQARQGQAGANAMSNAEASGLGAWNQQQNQARQGQAGANAMSNAEAAGLGAWNQEQARQRQAEADAKSNAGTAYQAVDVSPIYDRQAQLAQQASQANAQTQQALTAQRGAQTGLSAQQQAGLGEFAALEAQAQGAAQQGQIAQQASQAQLAQDIKAYDTNYQQAQADRKARMTQLSELLKSGNLSSDMRSKVVSEMVANDPNDPIARIYSENPGLLDQILRTSDLAADFANRDAAVGFMQSRVTDFGDREQLLQVFNSGEYSKYRWPDANALETQSLAWNPTSSEIAQYQEYTGKTYSPDNKSEIFAFSDMMRNAKAVGDQQMFDEMASTLQQQGINPSTQNMEQLRKAMPTLSKIMTDVNVDGYNVKWSADVKEGGLAPLFESWDGTSQGSTEDSNLDHLFWQANSLLSDNKQNPMTMSAFGSQFSSWLQAQAQKDPNLANILSAGVMTNSDVNNLAQRFVSQKSSTSSVVADYSSLTDPQQLVNAMETGPITAQSVADMTPEQWVSAWSNPKVSNKLKLAGFVDGNSWIEPRLTGDFGRSADSLRTQLRTSNIKPGSKVVREGVVYTVKDIYFYQSSGMFSDGTGYDVRAVGPDGAETSVMSQKSPDFEMAGAEWKKYNPSTGAFN